MDDESRKCSGAQELANKIHLTKTDKFLKKVLGEQEWQAHLLRKIDKLEKDSLKMDETSNSKMDETSSPTMDESCACSMQELANEVTETDKFLKKGLSDHEWESLLLKKMDKLEKEKTGTSKKQHKSIGQRIKEFFKSPKECNEFINREREEYLQSVKEKRKDESEEAKT